jgi:DNA-directed RNA polymerase subunit beta'
MERYRNIRVEPTEEAKAAMYSMVGYEGYDADYSFGAGSGEAVRLEDFDFGGYTS